MVRRDTSRPPLDETIRLVLVESRVLAGVGVREVIAREPDIEVVAEFRSPAEAIPVVAETGPDIVLVDVGLEDPSVAEATRRLTHGARQSAVIVVGGADDDASILGAIAVGAAAHVSEVAEPNELVAAIRRVAGGEDPLKKELVARPDLVERMVDAVRDGLLRLDGHAAMTVTPRELDILRNLASGLRNREIADVLGLSEQTVKNHLSSILHKLGASNRIQAVTYAVRQGWLLVDPERRRFHDRSSFDGRSGLQRPRSRPMPTAGDLRMIAGLVDCGRADPGRSLARQRALNGRLEARCVTALGSGESHQGRAGGR